MFPTSLSAFRRVQNVLQLRMYFKALFRERVKILWKEYVCRARHALPVFTAVHNIATCHGL